MSEITKIIRPVRAPGKYTSPYGQRVLNGVSQFHGGIDYINKSDTGDDEARGIFWKGDRSVLSMADGVVISDQDDYNSSLRWTEPHHSAGNMIIVKHILHGKPYFIRYLHLLENTVSIGEKVKIGQVLGIYSDAGYSFGPHVHVDMYNMFWERIDPTQIFLKGMSVK